MRTRIAILCILVLGLALWPLTDRALAAPAPPFELPDLEGRATRLTTLTAGGTVLLIFWTTECVYCYAHIRDLNALQERYGERGLQVVGINIGGEPRQEVALYAQENGVRYRLLADPAANLDVAEAYRVPGTPSFVLVDRQGELRYRGHRLAEVEARLPALLEGGGGVP